MPRLASTPPSITVTLQPKRPTSTLHRGPPAWSMAVRMEGNQEVSLLLAWNSCCSSVKKMPAHVGKPRVRPWVTREATSTTQAQQPSVRSRIWGILCLECCLSRLHGCFHCLGHLKRGQNGAASLVHLLASLDG